MQASQAVQANLNMFHLHLSTVSDGLKTAPGHCQRGAQASTETSKQKASGLRTL